MTVKVRFAPSPTGRLHVGNVRTALVNWLFARKQGGVFVLRIDDTDLERSTLENEQAIETDLTWLGLTWGERHNQSKRFDAYDAAAARLRAMGRLYPCYETQEELDRRRKVQLSRGQPPIYDRAALDLSDEDKARFEAEGRKPHWRFKLDGKRVVWDDLVRGHCEVDTASLSDPVLIREDGLYLYTLPSVVDDIDMAITHVVRGEDHVTNTGAQIEIFEALGASLPAFAHMSLLIGADGQALSKRLGSLSVGQMRDDGYEPMAITSHLGRIGSSDAVELVASMDELAAGFAFEKLGRAPARYDTADLDRLNAQAIHSLDYAAAQPRLAALGVDLGEGFWLAVRANLNRFGDARDWAEVLTGAVSGPRLDEAFKAAAIVAFEAAVPPGATPDLETWGQFTSAVKEATGAKGGALFKPLRQALTGRDAGPDMAALLPLIGRDRVLERLRGG
ncbi:MAG TPA: glutamate--tRNA ligase [Brevundimonas sp.]|jgi:glutamyl-tRNA synthetase|uniref:glutamate--tRNA ligase n=1 Tax=Brevundimonas sp. TaxID=1871086 RepID=UPI002C262A69|nr:glutamate--tRNA ligase [Brevundimonas sp.]HRH20392.1 glutamate--tRNA ligase [Brevundimonas sp.]